MSDLDLVGADLPLDRQNAKLRRIVAALMRRVERETDESGNAFTLFQRAIALEAEVAARTQDLQRALDALNAANAELEAATRAAEAASRAKSQFLAAASHDLRQPLNAAKLFIGSLAEAGLDPDALRVLDRLSSAVRSVEEIIGALIDISRLDSEAARASPAVFPIARIFEPIGNEFHHLDAAQGTDLRIMASSASVVSDPFYLRQIVQNLVSNAVRYGRGGRVLLGARRIGGGRLRIEVHDTGPGIAEADIPKIFREFERLEQPGGAPGVGLGLAIVERACRLLGHPLELVTHPGRGTRFCVTVPLAAGAAERAPESNETMIALVASAEPAFASLISGLLESWGMAALTAATEDEAVEQIALLGLAPDALIADESFGAAALAGAVAAAGGGGEAGRLRLVRIVARGVRPGPAPQGAEERRLVKPVRPHQLRAALA